MAPPIFEAWWVDPVVCTDAFLIGWCDGLTDKQTQLKSGAGVEEGPNMGKERRDTFISISVGSYSTFGLGTFTCVGIVIGFSF